MFEILKYMMNEIFVAEKKKMCKHNKKILHTGFGIEDRFLIEFTRHFFLFFLYPFVYKYKQIEKSKHRQAKKKFKEQDVTFLHSPILK